MLRIPSESLLSVNIVQHSIRQESREQLDISHVPPTRTTGWEPLVESTLVFSEWNVSKQCLTEFLSVCFDNSHFTSSQ